MSYHVHKKISPMVKGAFQHDDNVAVEDIGDLESFENSDTTENVEAEGGRISLKKKLKTQRRTRQALLTGFKSKATILMDRLYQSIFMAGRRIGAFS